MEISEWLEKLIGNFRKASDNDNDENIIFLVLPIRKALSMIRN